MMRIRPSLVVVACALLLLLRWLPSQGKNSPGLSYDAAACTLAHTLESTPVVPAAELSQNSTAEVRLFWWYRFDGRRRSARHAQRFTCSDGLRCVSNSRKSAFADSHGVVVWVGPGRPACLPPRRAQHTWVMEFSESPAIYKELLDSDFTRRFDLKVSHELDSDVVLTALHPLVEGGAIPPSTWLRLSADEAIAGRSAVVWIASYCPAHSRRAELVRHLQHALPSSVPLLSIGRCMHNHDEPLLIAKQADGGGNASTWMSKIRVLSQYTFCLIAENSIARDYVTEKLFHAFAAGCLPVYYGTIDVSQFLPTPTAAIQVLSFNSVQELRNELVALAGDSSAYRARMAWRRDAALVGAWWARMQAVTNSATTATKPAIFCAICSAVARHRSRASGGRLGSDRRGGLHGSPVPKDFVWPPLLAPPASKR